MNRIFLLSFLSLCITLSSTSCKEKAPTPKPVGHERIDIPKHNYVLSKLQHFSFNRSELSEIEQDKENTPNWVNINYPSFNAKIYGTYIPITPQKLKEVSTESQKLAFSHAIKADNISQTLYSDSINKVYGVVYTIEGNVASPCQFYLTDSISHFFRGSLYYNSTTSSDSMTEVTKTIREDIQEIVSSLRWGNN